MVVFCCNNCGEALKKQVVQKHSFKCSRNISVSCMDCHKDFLGNAFDAHTQCITEQERYGGKDYVAKPNQNKGAKKQAAWVEMVRSIQSTKKNIAKNVNDILTTISNYDNIPRKKASFVNFMRNSFRYMKINDIEAAWGLLEEEIQKGRAQNGVTDSGKSATNGTSGTANGENQKPEAVQNGVANGKKRKLEDIEPTNGVKKVKVEEESSELVADFNWTETIKDIVLSKNNQIKLNKLKKRVFKKYKNFYNVSTITEKFEKKFTKRLKNSGLIVKDDTVRLID